MLHVFLAVTVRIYFSVNAMCKSRMELVWKVVFHSILGMFHSILASSVFHAEISIPYHALTKTQCVTQNNKKNLNLQIKQLSIDKLGF